MGGYLDLLRRRPAFRTLFAAEVVSLTGDCFTVVAVSLLTIGAGDRLVLLALSFVAHSLPQALLAPLAGPLVDAMDRRRAFLVTAIAQAVLTFFMVGAAVSNAVALIPLLVLVRSALGAMREPALGASLPRVVEDDEVLKANTFLSLAWSVTFALGMAAGGLVAGVSPRLALLIDALSFALAAILYTTLPSIPPETCLSGSRSSPRVLVAGMIDASRRALRDPLLLRAVLGKTPLAIAGGSAWVLVNVVAHQRSFAGTAGMTLGILQAIRGIATGIGPVLSERALARGASPWLVSCLVGVITFAGIALMVFAWSPLWLGLAALAWGIGAGANWVLTSSEIQRRSPTGFVGRITALDMLAWTLGMCGSALATALIVEKVGHLADVTLGFVAAGFVCTIVLDGVRSFRPRQAMS